MAVVPPPSLPQPAPESPSQSPSDRSKCLPAYGITPPSPHTLTHISPTPSAFSKNLPCDLNVTYTPPNASIPLLPPSEFARMHLEHVTAHPPDSVLFPFLHGLEGDNEAQCTFFAASGAHAAGTAKGHYPTAGMVQDATGRVVRPPRYRGLLWVLCDDDLESAGGDIVPSGNDVRAEVDEGEGEYDTDSSDFSDEDGVEDGDVDMEVSDHDDAARVDAMDVDASAGGGIEPPPQSSIQNTEKYMHPITPLHISTIDIERTTTAHIHMTTPFPFSSGETLDDTALADGGATLGQNDDAPTLHGTSPSHQQHDRRHSDASSGTNSESASTSSSSTSSVFTSSEASGTTSATSLPSPSGVSSACFGTPDDSDEERFAFVAPETTTSKPTCGSRLSPHSKPIRSPPILTSTFLPSQLIQPVFQGNKCIIIPSRDDGADKEDYFELDVDWEFKSGKVPEGISLRNFGVQVPLYTSISDIVVYSPRGASPAALRLAARFRRAIERKLKERVSRWERGGFALHGWGGSVSEGKQQNEAEVVEDSHDIPSGFLKYGVYVLDADAERIERELGWMVVRKEGDFTCFGGCEGRGGSEGCEGCGPGVATEGERGGRTLGPVDHDMEVEVETEVEVKLEGRRQLHPHEQWHHYQHHQQHRLHNLSKSYTAHSRVHNPHTHTPNHELDPNFATCSPNQNYDQGPSPHLDRLHRCKRANTIDFAQREKDEMRDLTRASEIVSVFEEESEQAYPFISGSTTATFWDPRVGQVFLGNASDVPLWTPPVKKKVHPPSPQNSRQSLSSSHYSQSVPSPDLSRIYPASHQQNGSSNPESANTPTDSTLRDTGANEDPSPFDSSLNQPSRGLGFDICIECHEYAPLPSSSHLRAAEEHIRALEEEWVGMWMKTHAQNDDASHSEIPPRPPPHPSAIIHLPFPSSPQGTVSGLNALIPVIRFLERMVTPGGLGGWLSSSVSTSAGSVAGVGGSVNGVNGRRGGSNVPLTPKTPPKAPRLPSPWSPKPVSSPSSSGVDDSRKGMTNGNGYANGNANPVPSVNGVGTAHNGVSPPPTYAYATRYPHPPPTYRPRPLKVLLYSSDGYTESSVPALCLLMAVKGLSLPEAYLEMQVSKRRSFFVYQSEVGLLKRVEARLGVGNSSFRGRFNACGNGDVPRSLSLRTTTQPMVVPSQSHLSTEVVSVSGCASGSCGSHSGSGPVPLLGPGTGRQLTLTIPASSSAPSSILSAMPHSNGSGGARGSVMRRPRASTLPTFISDHQSWFDDARFDGSFPSRVLPFLYLGNLNHASNAYMLHALGITHVVSVGECALVPPPQTPNEGSNPQPTPSSNAQFVAGQGPGGQGSLWIEEREGRIKVLDIKGVCDDGIDTLEPQLHPICTWIEKARLAGGQVLVHCRVGVSRSATVTIAYVMQHLGLSLVEAYLVVRSRRLSVLIQPNMRLLYNLLGWEVRLARERAGGDERRLREELGRALSWPYLAKEVHALNEKYLG